MLRPILRAATLAGCASAFLAMPAFADPVVHVDYSQVSVRYSAGGQFSVTQNGSSSATGTIFDSSNPGAVLDRANIFNGVPGLGSFQLNFGGTVLSNGLDNLSFSGASFRATDALTTLAAPSIQAGFSNTGFGSDRDGITYMNGVLTIHGALATGVPGSPILNNPAGGSWVYHGANDAGIAGGGADGLANGLSIGAGARDSYTTGVLALLEISLLSYADGTQITATNADELFREALLHGGFVAADADMKIDVLPTTIPPVPTPDAFVLGTIGFVLLGWVKRRLI